MQDIYMQAKDLMQKSINALLRDFSTLRSSKVNINMFDNIKLDYYGTPTLLTQTSSVIAKDANTIIITPYEKHLLKDIEKTIQEANIGSNPNNDGVSVKLFFPPMTSEQRIEIAKQAKNMSEKNKIAIRNIRQDCNNSLKKLEKDKKITSDELKKGIEEIQKITDDFMKKIESSLKNKEEEIMKI